MRDGTTRRAVLRQGGTIAAATGAAALAGCVTGDAGLEDSLRIGAFQPVSADLAYYGEISLMGFYSGLAYKHGIDAEELSDSFDTSAGSYTLETEDVDYEILVRDTEQNPGTAQSVAEDLVVDEDVDVLFGGTLSESARNVISAVAEPEDVTYIVGPAADADVTVSADYCHETVFRASEHTAMDARAGGRYVAEEGDVSNVGIVHVDDAFGRSVANNYEAVLEDAGVDVVTTRDVSQEFDDFPPLIEEVVEEDGADGLVGGFTVAQLPQFLSAALGHDVQIFGGFAERDTTQLIGATIEEVLGEDFDEGDVQDAGLGPFTTRYHWNQYDNPINDEFTDLHVDAYGMVPDLFSAGTFVGASALAQAALASGSTDGADLAAEMRGMTVEDTPKGEDAYTFQEENNQAASDMTVAWPIPTVDEYQESWGAVVMPGEPIERYDADEVMVPSAEMDCDLG